MRTPAFALSIGIAVFVTACQCTPSNTPPDANGDAPLGPPRSYWRNPSPPACSQRLDPPRWRVTAHPGPEGSIRWVRSLRERDFENWRVALGFRPPAYRRTAPSLTGDGIASWIFVAELEDEHRMIGLKYADGSWGTAASVDITPHPRMWLPDVYVTALGSGGTRMLPLSPPDYSPTITPPEYSVRLTDSSGMFGSDIHYGGAYGTTDSAMPAWSPTTGDMVGFGDRAGGGQPGVGVGCVEGNRWFTEIPGLNTPMQVNYVRPDGDIIATSLGHIYILDGETGEPLRSRDLIESGIVEEPVYHRVAAYHPGCGLLVHRNIVNQSWFWVNDETMAPGPDLRLPADRPTSIGGWSGTPDCGLVASAGMGNLVRLNADGSVRYNTPIPPGFIAPGSPPVALADGGTLLMTDPPGWVRFSATGEITSTVHLDPTVVGERNANPDSVLAPDGTMYFMTLSAFSEIRFGAASTGAIPGPYLWPNSGLNWARTNSILPD
jgi:hypothetical protein